MKTTIVPAQITTVEDKITAHLSFTQLLLLVVPVFIGGALFIFLPPFANYALYKLGLALLVALICITLAIRVKERLVLEWIGILSRYNLRPKHYFFNKNSAYLRDIPKIVNVAEKDQETIVKAKTKKEQYRSVKLNKLVTVESAMADPDAEFHFRVNKKGVLHAHIKEV